MPLSSAYVSNRAIIVAGGKARIDPSVIVRDTFTNPVAGSANAFSTAHAGQAAAGTVSEVLNGAVGTTVFGPARAVIITVTHASAVVAMSGVITGLNAMGKVITEAWSVTAGGTSKTYTTLKTFTQVTSITETVAANASANTITAGTTNVFGLSAPVAVASAIKEVAAGVVVTTGTLVASSAGTNGTYSPATAPDGTKTYSVWYLSDNPEGAV